MAPTETPRLEAQLCFDLYAASRAITAVYRPALSELGLTYPQYLVLMVLWEDDDVTVGDLATRLRLDHGTLTPLLRRMEDAELVTRARRASDERVVEVGLAPRGERLRAEAPRLSCLARDATGLDDEQIASLQAVLKQMSAHLATGSDQR
ncbi:MarR family transcriptional regulator [Nocardioides aestuarii]|uniref:MarR family winged helix-turn-helix transcriptional regulator n=1 Tax=Nocardioides aestuarii TaxID=252231 RepID=A0ABW4TRZ7_9ACTN